LQRSSSGLVWPKLLQKWIVKWVNSWMKVPHGANRARVILK
jgi:hypothetical protein